MSKTISLNTKITFLATGDKYSIREQTSTGFQFKPIKFERGLPSVPRTFEEVKQEFLNNQIDIEGFEHIESDNTLVELIMDGYIKDSLITEMQLSISEIQTSKAEAERKVTEQAELITQQQGAIKAHEEAISENQIEIGDKHTLIEVQKTQIDELTAQVSFRDNQLQTVVSGKENEIATLKSEHETQNATQKAEWEKEKQAYEKTIAGLEVMAGE